MGCLRTSGIPGPAWSADAEGAPGHQSCCHRGPVAGRGGPRLRGVPGLGLPAGGPLPGRGGGGVRAAVAAAEDLAGGGQRRCGAADHRLAQGADRGRAWTPGRTRSPGTWSTITRSRVSPATISRYLTRARAGHPRAAQTAAARLTSGSPPSCPTSAGSPTSSTGSWPAARETEIVSWLDDHSRYALSVTAHRGHHRPGRPGHLPRRRRRPRRSGLDFDRQRHGLHDPVLRRPGRPQRPGARTARPGRHPEERPARTTPRPRARSSDSSRPCRNG